MRKRVESKNNIFLAVLFANIISEEVYLFGYVKPFKPEMKIKEFDTYNSIYCGLCKQLSVLYGRCSNATLSYDFTFLSILGMALDDKFNGYSKKRCSHNFFKKKICCNSNRHTEYSAAVAMIMMYFKIKDNLDDCSFFKKIIYFLFLPLAKHYCKKAKLKYPQIYDATQTAMINQKATEKTATSSLDQAAHSSADMLSFIFKNISKDENQQKVLSIMGYHIGRYIYFCDALSDIEEDLRQKSFNPFVNKFAITTFMQSEINDIYKYGKNMINMTLSEISNCYVLLDIKRFSPILDNIIYLGLPNVLQNILAPKKGDKK